MTISFKRRSKKIRAEKKLLGVNIIPEKTFNYLQAHWRVAVDGPCIGTLEQFIKAKP